MRHYPNRTQCAETAGSLGDVGIARISLGFTGVQISDAPHEIGRGTDGLTRPESASDEVA
jgi:hypothetical protein